MLACKSLIHRYFCFFSPHSFSYEAQKEEIIPEVHIALSAMTVLTTFQMDGYAMIRF